MALYTYTSLTQALAELGLRLSDPTSQFWSDAEKTLYIQEALRTWNALTSEWRSQFTFPTTQNLRWYDLSTVANTLRPMTVTDASLIQLIEYHVLEPVNIIYPLVWGGSLQFTFADILNAIQRRRDEVLGVTGCTVARQTVPAAAGPIVLPDNVIDIRRVSFLPTNPSQGSASPLFQDDSWALDQFNHAYTVTPGAIPSVYVINTQQPLSFDTDIPPGVPASYGVLTVNAGAALSAAGSTVLIIPNDWTWVVKWGVLADLMGRESNAKDVLRQKYAEGRYRQGLSLLSAASALLAARIGNVPLQIDAIRAADQYQTGWEGAAAGTPDTALVVGQNLIALSPKPDAGPYSLTVTVVQNAPLPTVGGDFIQVGRDTYDVILDYAQHLAAFKMGGMEFLQTIPLLDRFMQEAALANSKLGEQGEFQKVLYNLSQREESMNPRYSGASPAEGGDQ